MDKGTVEELAKDFFKDYWREGMPVDRGFLEQVWGDAFVCALYDPEWEDDF